MQKVCPSCRGEKVGSMGRDCKQCKGLGYVTYANVVSLGNITVLDHDPDKVLANLIGKLDRCVVLGMDKQDNFRFYSSMADGAEAILLTEIAKKRLLEYIDGDTDDG